jgi:hypothetical protein
VTIVRRSVGIAVAVALIALLGALSQLPYAAERSDRALVRLSWRARGERTERCRRATPEELAAMAAHMRQEVICEGARIAPYRLRVAIDGRTREDGVVAGSGVAGDRPIYVLREFALAPGHHRIEVRFEKVAGDDGALATRPGALDDRASDREAEARRRAIPPRLLLDTTVTAAANGVLLVTYSTEHQQLVLLGGSGGERVPE